MLQNSKDNKAGNGTLGLLCQKPCILCQQVNTNGVLLMPLQSYLHPSPPTGNLSCTRNAHTLELGDLATGDHEKYALFMKKAAFLILKGC